MVGKTSSRLTNLAVRFVHSWAGWVAISLGVYVLGVYVISALVSVLSQLGILANIDSTTSALVVRVIMYALLIVLMIVVPAWLRQRISVREMAIDRPMTWKDIAIGSAGFVLYILIAMAALALAGLIPGADLSQAQTLDVGQVFGVSRMIVFVVLVIVTPFAEELLFRGLLYGGLRARKLPVWASALVVSALFGLAHGQLNVGIDVFCLSLVACYARELTGSIWAGVVMHMIKNFIAFVIVFILNQVML